MYFLSISSWQSVLSSISQPKALPVRGSQTSSLPILCLIYFIFATNSVSISAKLNQKRPRVIPTLETKIKITVILKLANEQSILDVNMEYCL
jgi:hypothetical protein